MPEQSLKIKAVNGIAWQSINTFGNMIVGFIVGIILARRLMPSDYGAVAMVGVFTSVLQIFTDGGLTTALIRKEDRTEADKSTIYIYNIVACYVIYAIIYLIAPLIADFYDMPILCKLARVSCLTMLITPWSSIHGLSFIFNIDFKTPACISIVCNLFSSCIAIWMAYNDYGVWALAVPGPITALLSSSIIISIVRWKPRTGFSRDSFRELFGFSSKLLGTTLVERIYNNITPLVVGKFFSPAQLGLFEKAKGWPSLPSNTVTGVMQSVTLPVLSKMQDDTERLKIQFSRMLRVTAFFFFPIMIGLAAIARPLTLVVLTEKWIDSVVLMQIICFYMMWGPIQCTNQNLLTVTGNSQYLLKNEIIRRICCLILMGITLPFGLEVFCLGNVFVSFISLYINTYYTKKIIDYSFWDQLKDYLPIIFNSLVMGALCLSVQQFFESQMFKLVAAIFVGIVYYPITSHFINKEEYNELIDILGMRLPFLNRFKNQ